MVVRGHRQPLVQEDMWDLNDQDSTGYINRRFQHYMSQELQEARVRYQEKLRTKPRKGKDPEEAYENGMPGGMGKGISKDVLMMVKKSLFIVVYILPVFFLEKQAIKRMSFSRRKRGKKMKRRERRKRKRKRKRVLTTPTPG